MLTISCLMWDNSKNLIARAKGCWRLSDDADSLALFSTSGTCCGGHSYSFVLSATKWVWSLSIVIPKRVWQIWSFNGEEEMWPRTPQQVEDWYKFRITTKLENDVDVMVEIPAEITHELNMIALNHIARNCSSAEGY